MRSSSDNGPGAVIMLGIIAPVLFQQCAISLCRSDIALPGAPRMKFLFVVNPTSGGITKEAWISAIADYFEASDHSHDWYEMQGESDEAALKYWIESYKPDRVVAVGGDGTLRFLA